MTNEKDVENILLVEFYEWRHILDLADYALSEIKTKFEIFRKEMDISHKNPIEHIKTRVKKYDSIVEKLERKGYAVNPQNARDHIYDIAGIRIVCPFESDIEIIREYIDKLERENSLKIIEIKDYIKNPKPNGYKSLHVIVEIPVKLLANTEHVKVEIQIRTVAMDFWACLEHKILYKKDIEDDDELRKRLKKCATMIAYLDREMFEINEELKQRVGKGGK